MSATITVDASEVYEKLNLIRDIPRVLAPPTKESLELLKAAMKVYPAVPSGSTYIRTFDLRGGWHCASVLSGNILGRVWNEGVGYADLVQSEAKQTDTHRGNGWQTEVKVSDASAPEIIKIFDAYMGKILK